MSMPIPKNIIFHSLNNLYEKNYYAPDLAGVHRAKLRSETFPVNGTTDPWHTIYAFKNTVLHIDYKTSVSGATLLIQDGKILNSGTGIPVPSNAVVFDLSGKHIYPGLIDIFSDYGMTGSKTNS
ncbi:MAG: hypothetical protein IPL24_12750 [Bacteroidetes bacterium]|nr:hypothetical protein [Bacteroidota bacterium]